MHWQRWRKHGDPLYQRPSLDDRFWSRVQKTDTCWLWTGALFQGSNYGMFTVNHKPALAHRIAYELRVGPIPPGTHIDHLCRIRHCVNPAHLEPVSPKANLMRGQTMAARNAAKTHCPQGHVYDDENTYRYKGKRLCRECRRLQWQVWREWRDNQ